MIFIDRNKEYIVEDYTFKNYVLLSEKEVRLVWEWRNHPDIRKWMANSDIIPYESHLSFINNLNSRKDAYYWLVLKNGNPIATFNLTHIDYTKNSGMPGFYLSPDEIDSGEGFILHYYYKLLVFNQLGLELLEGGFVKVGNVRAYLMGKFWGGNPVGYFEEDGEGYIEQRVSKVAFESVDKTHLIKDFSAFARKNRKIDWKEVISQVQSHNE